MPTEKGCRRKIILKRSYGSVKLLSKATRRRRTILAFPIMRERAFGKITSKRSCGTVKLLSKAKPSVVIVGTAHICAVEQGGLGAVIGRRLVAFAGKE